MSMLIQEKETRERLLKNVKKECKQLMEVAVTKKFINEDNSCITSLCATIESCLLHGLKRSAIGLFKTSTTLTLLQKVSKTSDEAMRILKMCEDYDRAYCTSSYMNSTSNSSTSNQKSFNSMQSMHSQQSQQQSSGSIFSRRLFAAGSNTAGQKSNSADEAMLNGRSFSPIYYKGSNCYKFLWIRMALLNKCLIKIIEHLISNASKFYAPFALIADPVDGPIFSSLLIGPCALEYTRMKSCDHLWNDPNADELIQRYKMHSSGVLSSTNQLLNNFISCPLSSLAASTSAIGTGPMAASAASAATSTSSPKTKLGLNGSLIAKRKASINAILDDLTNAYSINLPSGTVNDHRPNNRFATTGNLAPNAATHVTNASNNREMSQLQQMASPLCTSPNYQQSPVSASANSAKEYVESLHQNSKSQLIYGKNNITVYQKETQFAGYLSLHSTHNGLVLKWMPNQLMNGSSADSIHILGKTRSGYWDYMLNVDINTIVYLHCHQQGSQGASIVLVGQDGVQYPPIRFPKGSHLLQFLTCLESGLVPDGYLDPPLRNEFGKGKVFPKLQRKSTKNLLILKDLEQVPEQPSESVEDENGDFVFRIINSKSNVSVTTVLNESPKKLEFSLSLGGDDSSTLNTQSASNAANAPSINLVNSIFPKKKPKLNFFFSSFSFSASNKSKDQLNKNPSIESYLAINTSMNNIGTDSDSVKSAPVVLSSGSYDQSSFDTGSQFNNPITPSSVVLDNTNQNGLLILSKVENIQQSSSFANDTFGYDGVNQFFIRSSLKTLCEDMRRQILSRAFYGWLAYHRQLKTINLHLIGLINCDKNCNLEDHEEDADEQQTSPMDDAELENLNNSLASGEKSHLDNKTIGRFTYSYLLKKKKLDQQLWTILVNEKTAGVNSLIKNKQNFYKIVYYNGIDNKLRKTVWPFLLEHYTIDMSSDERELKDAKTRDLYKKLIDEWRPFEEYIKSKEQTTRSLTVVNEPPLSAKTPTNSPSLNSTQAGDQSIKESPKPSSVLNKANADHKCVSPKLTNKKPGLFSFNILKTKTNGSLLNNSNNSNPNAATKPVVDGENRSQPAAENTTANQLIFNKTKHLIPFDDKRNLMRNDSSLSNEVFYADESSASAAAATSGSFLSKFSARNLFAKLMQKNLNEPTDGRSMTLNETKSQIERIDEIGDETAMNETEIARELVNSIIAKVAKQLEAETIAQQQPHTQQQTPIQSSNSSGTKLNKTISNLSNLDNDSCNESVKSDSIYKDSKMFFSNTTSSIDNEEVYHDVETDYFNDTATLMNDEADVSATSLGKCDKRADQLSLITSSLEQMATSSPSPSSSSTVVVGASNLKKQFRKTLSNQELIESFSLNMHRIDKDVTRCDRNYYYFVSNENLKKLKNIMYTYVWENLNIGYIQGMCDLVAPLLVIFDDEPMAYSCFKQLMKRMSSNFPHGTAMDQHFANMRTLIQIVDSDLFEHMHHRGDYTHFYFSYRWFLLDFKRELVYDDVFSVWETIWAAKYVCSAHFHLFIALALVETYRDIIIENNMDFTDIIKFFNEMAEKHDVNQMLELARSLIQQIQNLIDNKNDNNYLEKKI